jgi:hypothetical protein
MVVFLLLGSVGQARADMILFNDFGPGSTYNAAGWWNIAGTAILPAMKFTPSATAQLTSLAFGMTIPVQGGVNGVTVELRSDAGGVPGALIESFDLSGQTMPALGTQGPPLTATSVTNPTLTAGTNYWLVAVDTNPNQAVWNFNDQGITGGGSTTPNGGASWQAFPTVSDAAFEVFGTQTVAAPGPSGLVLFGTASASFGGYMGWRRRKQRPAA